MLAQDRRDPHRAGRRRHRPGNRFADVEVADLQPVQFLRDIRERLDRIGVRHRVAGEVRRELVADALRAPDVDHRFGDFERKPRAVLDAAAIGVGAAVGAVAQELVEQVAVGAVQFDAVEAGGLGVLGRGAELRDDAGQLVQFERARRHDLDLAVVGEGFALDRQRRRARPAARRRGNPDARRARHARAARRSCRRPDARRR